MSFERTNNINTYINIPDIIHSIGLTAYEISLYIALNKNSNEHGVCLKSKKVLAEESGMSPTKVSTTKRDLCKPRKELGGKPLIRVEKNFHENGGNAVDNISITDIWEESVRFFEDKNQM